VDGLSDDTKMETQRDIHQRAMDDLVESGLEQKACAAMNTVELLRIELVSRTMHVCRYRLQCTSCS